MSDIFGENQESEETAGAPAEVAKELTLAVDLSAKGAIAVIKEMDSLDALVAFVDGEGRKTVMAAFTERHDELMPAPVADATIGTGMEDGDEPADDAGDTDDDEYGFDAEDFNTEYQVVIDEVENRPNFQTVSINGYVWKVKRGDPVWVPAAVLEVLNNAIAERLIQEEGAKGQITTRRQKFSYVPFRVLKVRHKK